nr:expressed protein [Hymenolepis microstoma]
MLLDLHTRANQSEQLDGYEGSQSQTQRNACNSPLLATPPPLQQQKTALAHYTTANFGAAVHKQPNVAPHLLLVSTRGLPNVLLSQSFPTVSVVFTTLLAH